MKNFYAKFMQIWLKFHLNEKCYSMKLQEGWDGVLSQSMCFFFLALSQFNLQNQL